MGKFTLRATVVNKGGIAQERLSGGWYVVYETPEGVCGMYVRYDSRKSVRKLLTEIGIDIKDAIVERVR